MERPRNSPPLEQSGFLPANAFAFDGASQGWRRMIGERLSEVLARALPSTNS